MADRRLGCCLDFANVIVVTHPDPDNVDTREYLGEGYVSKGELDLAWLELLEIEKRCGATCEEYRALEKALRSSRSQY